MMQLMMRCTLHLIIMITVLDSSVVQRNF